MMKKLQVLAILMALSVSVMSQGLVDKADMMRLSEKNKAYVKRVKPRSLKASTGTMAIAEDLPTRVEGDIIFTTVLTEDFSKFVAGEEDILRFREAEMVKYRFVKAQSLQLRENFGKIGNGTLVGEVEPVTAHFVHPQIPAGGMMQTGGNVVKTKVVIPESGQAGNEVNALTVQGVYQFAYFLSVNQIASLGADGRIIEKPTPEAFHLQHHRRTGGKLF